MFYTGDLKPVTAEDDRRRFSFEQFTQLLIKQHNKERPTDDAVAAYQTPAASCFVSTR